MDILQERIESWALSAFPKKIEYRYPLLDKRIIEFAIGIPEEMYYPKKGKNRHLIKNAVKDLLPLDILWSPKPNETKVNNTIKHTYTEALKLVQKMYKKGLFKCRTDDYLDGIKVESAIKNFDFKKSDVFELGSFEAVILFCKAKEYLTIIKRQFIKRKEEIMKKKWVQPSFKKISIKKITLSGSSGNLENNSGSGSKNKRA